MSTKLFDGTFIIPLCDGNGFIHTNPATGRIIMYELNEKGFFVATEETSTRPAIELSEEFLEKFGSEESPIEWADDDVQVWTNPLDGIFDD